jgi:hypothetical protein
MTLVFVPDVDAATYTRDVPLDLGSHPDGSWLTR